MYYNPNISVVIPVYGCKTSLIELVLRLEKTLKTISEEYEIILVNDASPDNPWNLIKELSAKNNRIKGVNFSRNFGQHFAITAGIDYSNGDWVVVMDCDLQDKPEEIIKLYNKAKEGVDIVLGRRFLRKDNLLKRLTSKLFFKLYDYLTDMKTDHTVGNFGIYSRKVIEQFNLMREQSRIFTLFIKWLGFSPVYIDIDHSERIEGKSSYTYSKLFNLAIDGIVTHSNKPLRMSIKFGFLIAFFALFFGIYIAVRYFFYNVPIGWTSIMVTIFFIGGLLFANLGLLGLYIGKIFSEVKNRPLYIVNETSNIVIPKIHQKELKK